MKTDVDSSEHSSSISGSPGAILLFGDTCQCLEKFLTVTTGGVLLGYSEWLRAKDAATHLTVHRTAPHNKELPNLRCQKGQG